MTEEDASQTQRECRERTLQEIIDAMVRAKQDRSVDDVAGDLRQRIAESGLPAKPNSWLQAVADGVVRGDAYVVSADTLRTMDIPPPATREHPHSIT
ncbi:hypothetical protein V3N99_12690 [Dermatophilaceae bacterium Soc4.6]